MNATGLPNNPLPQWIQADFARRKIGRAAYAILQSIANADDVEAQADGSLLVASRNCGAAKLAMAAGYKERQAFNALRELKAGGYVVMVSRGGRVKGGKLANNTYAIPAMPGCLDHIKCRRNARPTRLNMAAAKTFISSRNSSMQKLHTNSYIDTHGVDLRDECVAERFHARGMMGAITKEAAGRIKALKSSGRWPGGDN